MHVVLEDFLFLCAYNKSFCFFLYLQAHIEVVALFSELKKQTLGELTRSVSLAYFICVVVYSAVGIFGYLSFGDSVTSDLLVSYDHMDAWIIMGMALMALKSITSYPVVLFCARLVSCFL